MVNRERLNLTQLDTTRSPQHTASQFKYGYFESDLHNEYKKGKPKRKHKDTNIDYTKEMIKADIDAYLRAREKFNIEIPLSELATRRGFNRTEFKRLMKLYNKETIKPTITPTIKKSKKNRSKSNHKPRIKTLKSRNSNSQTFTTKSPNKTIKIESRILTPIKSNSQYSRNAGRKTKRRRTKRISTKKR